ncbi:MAG: VWA domain-containing protein [Chitinophagaceae bacterium]|nr:VWA domain-containing protein [Chitinophagaceae bacterium]
MKGLPLHWFCSCSLLFGPATGVLAQYYLTGTTLKNQKDPAPYVKMKLHSNGALHRSGSTGDFGIPSSRKTDTVTCWTDQYDTIVVPLQSGVHNTITMQSKAAIAKEQLESGKLSSLTPMLAFADDAFYYSNMGETYAALVQNRFLKTAQHPQTGFSPNTNKASYANIRRFIENKSPVNPNAVRIEEMINYFSLHGAPPPAGNETFSIQNSITDCPWNPEHHLLIVHARAKTIDLQHIPPANLVFLIDNSGSMDMPNRMPLLKSAFGKLVETLRPQDKVTIVTYGGIAGLWLPPTPGHLKDSIKRSIENIEPGGATAGSGGIKLAYELAAKTALAGGNNRVILATDGDFNVGITQEKELEDLIKRYRETGIKLTCLGVGMGNLKDSKIEALAREGQGTYAYLDSEQEAEKVLVTELTQNLYSVAAGTTVHINLNPAAVHSYKLLGYENRRGALQSEQPMLVGGDIGSGFSINAVFEIASGDTALAKINGLGSLSMQYIPAGASMVQKDSLPLQWNYLPLGQSPPATRLIASLALFGQMLRKEEATSHMRYDDLISLVQSAADATQWQQVQLAQLIQKAAALQPPQQPERSKKRHKKRAGL